MSLSAFLGSLDFFLEENDAVTRMFHKGISGPAYWIAKHTFGLVHHAILCLSFTMFFLYFLPAKGNFGLHYANFMMVQFICAEIGFAFAIITPIYRVAMVIGGFIIQVSLMFSGSNPTLTKLKQNAGQWFFTETGFAAWSLENYYITEITNYNETNCDIQQSLNFWGYDTGDYSKNMVGFWTVFDVFLDYFECDVVGLGRVVFWSSCVFFDSTIWKIEWSHGRVL